jgi:hypothetical protein
VPHLQFDLTVPVTDETAGAFAAEMASLYAAEMDTGTDHVAVTVADDVHVRLGRGVDGPACVLQADVRRGRDHDRRRSFALSAMAAVADRFGVPEPNLKTVFTQHAGEELMGVDRVGGEWTPGEGEG